MSLPLQYIKSESACDYGFVADVTGASQLRSTFDTARCLAAGSTSSLESLQSIPFAERDTQLNSGTCTQSLPSRPMRRVTSQNGSCNTSSNIFVYFCA